MLNLKKLLTTGLLVFVVISVAYFIYDEVRLAYNLENTQKTESEQSEINQSDIGDYMNVYYFHGTQRCHECLEMEAYIEECLESYFSEELADGTIRLRVINIDHRENQDYIDKYFIMYNSVILQKFSNNEATDWKYLDEAWNLVNKKNEFINFVKEEIKDFKVVD
ncbi:MAG: nitrophenyl compound nitroreductase subunit ArsF family protein [Petrotogales bacterium]